LPAVPQHWNLGEGFKKKNKQTRNWFANCGKLLSCITALLIIMVAEELKQVEKGDFFTPAVISNHGMVEARRGSKYQVSQSFSLKMSVL